jgi:hypothetical protein
MVSPAMDQQQERRRVIAPVGIMQPQPLRKIAVRGWAGQRGAIDRHAGRNGAPTMLMQKEKARIAAGF